MRVHAATRLPPFLEMDLIGDRPGKTGSKFSARPSTICVTEWQRALCQEGDPLAVCEVSARMAEAAYALRMLPPMGTA